MDFDPHNAPLIGSTVIYTGDKSTPAEKCSVVDNDDYPMVGMLVIKNEAGKTFAVSGSLVEIVEDAQISPDLETLLNQLRDETPPNIENVEAWAYQDGWNSALDRVKLALLELSTSKN